MDIEDWAKRPSNCSSKTDCCTTSPTCTTCGPNSSPVCPGWAKNRPRTSSGASGARSRFLSAGIVRPGHPIRRGNHGQIPRGTLPYVRCRDARYTRGVDRSRRGGRQDRRCHHRLLRRRGEPADHQAAAQSGAANRSREQSPRIGKSGGQNFVITGRFSGHSRDELKELIEAHGGKTSRRYRPTSIFGRRRKDRTGQTPKGDQTGRTPHLRRGTAGDDRFRRNTARDRERFRTGTRLQHPFGSGNYRQNRRRQHGTGVAVLGGKRHSRSRGKRTILFRAYALTPKIMM